MASGGGEVGGGAADADGEGAEGVADGGEPGGVEGEEVGGGVDMAGKYRGWFLLRLLLLH